MRHDSFGTRWIADVPAEKRMEEFGVSFRVEEISLDDIDWDESLTNGGRLIDPLNPDLVTEYKTAMESGDRFPACVLRRMKSGRMVIESGNHRMRSALQAGIKKAPVYVFESSDQAVIDLMPRVLNRLHGKRQGREEALIHATHAVEQYGYEHGKAEQLFGLSKGSVSAAIRAKDVKKLLMSKGVNTQKLTQAQLVSLHPLKNDNVIVAAGRMISDSGINGSAADEFIRSIRKNRTEAQQMAAVADLEKRIGGRDPGPVLKVPRNVRTKFLTWLTTGENYLENSTELSQLQITESGEQARIRQRIERLRDNLARLLSSRSKAISKNRNGRHPA